MFPIALVDDAKLFRESLIKSIQLIKPGCTYYEYANGKDFIDRFHTENYKPKVVLMDISMPFVNGFEATAWLKKYDPTVPVLVVSFIEKDISVLKMFKLGANGFITKNTGLETLLEAIEEVAAGRFYYNIGTSYTITKSGLYCDGKKIISDHAPLTSTEETILALLCSDKTIAEISYGSGRPKTTIEAHKANISRKIGIHSRQGLFLYAVKMGLVHIG